MRWNWDVLDDYIAMDVSVFTSADPPDITAAHPEASHWVLNYVLNTVLSGGFTEPLGGYAALLLRRTTVAYDEYESARSATLSFVEDRAAGGQPVRTYLLALHHWEQCVAHSWQAAKAHEKISGEKLFEKGDGSPEEKLNKLHNRSKHSDSALGTRGQMPPKGPIAMWLTNDGLATTDCVMSWSELGQLVGSLGEIADLIQNPAGLRETLESRES